MKKNIPYGHQWVDDNDIKEVVKILKSDWLTQGSKVEEFEKAVAKYCKAKYAVAVSSGTAALYLAYVATGIKPGDEVITTPLTFAATANMIFFCGAKPIFSDIKEDSLNIDPKEIEKKITKKTKAIVTVDFAGNPCDYEQILKIAKKHKILLIEDACHALGAEYAFTSSAQGKGKKVGSFADMTVFSFHPVKHITTGEGGMILTNNKNFYDKLKVLRSHGIVKKPEKGAWYYEIENPSFNFRITDIQCALGLSQLKKLDKFIKRRREIVKIYNNNFKNTENLILPKENFQGISAWHVYTVQLIDKDRRKFFEQLQKSGIGAQVHYMPLHMHPFYQKEFGYKLGDFPVAEKYYERAVTLPLFPKMTNNEVERVINTTKKLLNKSYE
ncbi:MAG: UDP-4-amino-4,6-dideoxy-N-acetyl-beta-L-altrosamine transaminase [Candidatus Staskawiczbacteria bacterium]|nr:UDP-4-amino-4,6-dideoxy-N-acetyl-beta-L-altrosamine transaminase [Candidatus Staskawiczbacteria bacterium]MBI3337257.1 UDP-4-amino-4,6-dideoxy-N-acetyl-beta-L-altrosamine transaminase [Candidatus Staskawiczbacteria bacterium]